MSIVKLRKVTLYGAALQRDEVLQRLQQMGCLHLIDLNDVADHKTPHHAYRSEVHEAIKYLRATPAANPNQHKKYTGGRECLETAREVLRNKHLREQLQDERDFLAKAIDQTRPWGDFRIPQDPLPHRMRLWFYPIPHRRLDRLLESHRLWQKISEDVQFQYVAVISDHEPIELPAKPVELDPRPLSELQSRLEFVDEKLALLNWERVTLTRWNNLLKRDLDQADDEAARMEALTMLVESEHVFALQGWAPVSTLESLQTFCNKNQMALDVQVPQWNENPPTLLKNPTAVAGAEGAVTFYITPAYRSWDPTWIMYFSFAIFFAMIMSDAAYGMMMGLVLLVGWKRMGKDDKGRRFRSLMLALVVATIVYGVAIGSYFGVTPSGLERLQLKINGMPLFQQREMMMLISLAIGVAHLVLSNLITAWRMRGRLLALGSVGWAGTLLGGLVYGIAVSGSNQPIAWLAESLSLSPASVRKSAQLGGMYVIIGGLAAVFLFSSTRPLFSTRSVDWVMRILDGLLALTNVTKIFGDTLSYLRLFALGLASAQLAVTFNGLADDAMQVPGLGILLAILILVAGHGINFILGVIGGVVHGLRLNCIEFFNWSLTEEGTPFRAFCKKV
ncbi:V-type ATP synthase subunit I [Novipirellula sp. SH528]|uniref:V-type ATP synthase subunit I n=1 Tax=Novipirellula sp. SH528 TaxID=3454466 RepID=UPI003FA0CFCD